MKILTKIFQWLSLIFMGAMSILTFINVISRKFLSSTIAWTDEVVIFLFVWTSMLGAAFAFLNNKHLGMDLLSQVVKSRTGKIIVNLLSFVCTLLVGIGLIVFGRTMVMNQMRMGTTSPGMGIPLWLQGLALPVGGALIILAAVIFIGRFIYYATNVSSDNITIKKES